MPRQIRQPGQGGMERGDPPAYTRPGDQFLDPVFRARLEQAILQQHERITGETPWNNNRRNVPREVTDTRVVVHLEWPPRVNQARDECPGAPTAQVAWADNTAEHRQNLLDRVMDMKTKLLECFFFLIYIFILLHFPTYIQFLCAL